MGMPAARLTDMHTCPICMGAPLPIAGIGAINVLIGFLPAARISDFCVCIPPIVPDPIIFGSPTVLIMGMPASRMADPTGKGGVILPPCCPTVLIGLVGVAVPGMPSLPGMPAGPVVFGPGQSAGQAGAVENEDEPVGNWPVADHSVEFGEQGRTLIMVGARLAITGSRDFCDRTLDALDEMCKTPSGSALLDSLQNSDSLIAITETSGGNKCTYPEGGEEGRFVQPDGTPGAGVLGIEVRFNPDLTQIGDGTEAWMTRPPWVGLAHELVHADDAARGIMVDGLINGVKARELQAVGLPPFEGRPFNENRMRDESGEDLRPRY